MGTPKDHLDQIELLATRVKSHPMCLRFEEFDDRYFVKYPEGMVLGGAQVSKGMGKIKALKLLNEAMERHWKENLL